MTRACHAALPVLAVLLAACSTASAPAPPGTAVTSPTPTAVAAATIVSRVSATPAPGATVTPAPNGSTGVDGVVTLGPTCPVQRADSPCADRPYAARIAAWRGGVQVAATMSGVDGRFVLLLPPGDYRIVGESAGAFPRATAVDVTVVAGRLTSVQIRYDSGIR